MKSLSMALLGIGLATAPAWAQEASPVQQAQVYTAVAPMNETVVSRMMPQVEALLEKMLAEKRGTQLDGVKVFESGDKFLPGKIAIGLVYVLLSRSPDDPQYKHYVDAFREIADMTIDDVNDTWGIYYYTSALYKLKQAGLLDQAISPATLEKLRGKLDWRLFVNEDDLTLIDLPNNYYGVAFSVARLRMLLGWEDEKASEALLARTLDHYRKYSGEYGFADETDGKGRFDRYSVLLIGEIAQRLIETGMETPADVKTWLRKSVDVLLPRFNMTGEGFEYGRSIGPYGETAFLEVLTAAVQLGLLSDEENAMAYAFSSRITARYMDFWVRPRTGSVDLWDDGRRTDAYRGKHRILGENLSLARQYLYTNAIWNAAGFKDKQPDAGYGAWLKKLPAQTTTYFSRGDYDRALVTLRDGDRVIGLPLINGATGQHMNTPYYPVPYSNGLLAGSADASYPHLVPRFHLSDGSVLMPLAWFKDIKVEQQGDKTIVTYRQDAVDRMGEKDAVVDDRLQVETRYEFSPGSIARSDRVTSAKPIEITKIDMELATFSTDGSVSDTAKVNFAGGGIRQFTASGLDGCTVSTVSEDIYQASTGAFASKVTCTGGKRTLTDPLDLGWTIAFE